MNNGKKVFTLGNRTTDLPVVVQKPSRTSSTRINEDIVDDYDPPMYGGGGYGGSGGGSAIYKLFVQPFVDVLRTFKFAAMQFSNSLRLMWKALTVFNGEEFEDEVSLYNEKRQAIDKQWEPLKKKISDQIGKTDPVFKMSVIGPEVFFADKAFRAGLEAGKPIAEILTATGWDQLKNNFKTDFDPNENLNKNSARMQKNQKRLLKKLNRLFFTSSESSASLYESDENEEEFLLKEQKAVEDLSPEEKIKKFMQVSGLQDQLDQTKIERSENILNTIPKLKKILLPLIYSSEILATKNFQEFSEAVKKIQSAGAKINVPLQKIEQEINANAEKLAVNEDFQAKVAGAKAAQKDKSDAKVDPKIALEKAKLATFNSVKEGLNQNIIQQLKEAIPKIEKILKENEMELDSETLSAMEKDKFDVVKRAAKVYKAFINSYKKIQENYSTAT